MPTVWSLASVFGPLYIARMRETTGNYATALQVIAGLMASSILLPIIVHPPRREDSREDPRTFGLTPHLAPPRD
jgi:OFA family oxalate/formate antiporter-like MFS transporter